MKFETYKTALINLRLYGEKYGGLQLIIDNDYPITCFNFNPFYKIYGISFAIRNFFHFSFTFDFNDYEALND